MKNIYIFLTILLVAILILAFATFKFVDISKGVGHGTEQEGNFNSPSEIEGELDSVNREKNSEDLEEHNEIIESPSDLALPFDIEKMDEGISPFGIIRHNKDKGHGHGGIDIGLQKGDSIYSVADAEIIYYELNPDGRGGNDVHLLLTKSEREGEGWGFLIEHMILEEGLGVGSKVLKEQKIGESSITRGSNHMQFTYLFNDFEYYKESKCWVEFLEESEKIKFDEQFEKVKQGIVDWWSTAYEDGYYPYKALIENEDPKPCYPLGTDAREREKLGL